MMEIRSANEGSELVDPLADKSSLSLFRRNFNLSSLSSSAPISNPNSSIFESLDARLKARVLSSPDKLLKQTKTILEENVLTEKQKVPRERRPGLGLKRAKFSAKPIPSQPTASLDFSIDVDKLSDPEEFFAAFERMENAKKEVQRLNGEPLFPLFDLDQNRVSSAPRRRRPSLLGKSATFANRFHSLKALTDDETPLPSQETFDNGIRSPTHNDVLPDAKGVNSSPNVREPESKPMKDSKVSELDELLSLNFEGLDENERQNLLREKLQIKNVDIGKAFFPDWRVQLRESWTSSSVLQKRNDVIAHQLSKSKTTRSGDHVSPAKSRSPLASISLLNRHIYRRSPSMDQFSALQIDLSPAEPTNFTSEPEIRVDQAGQSDEVDVRENLHEFRRPTAHEKENNAAIGDDTFVSVANDVDPIIDPKEKEDVVGQCDSISNKTDSCEFRRSPVHVGDDTFVSVANDVDPIIDPKEKEDVVGQCDSISNKTDSCEFRRSPVHVENHNAGSVEDGPALASIDVSPTSESERHEDEVDATLTPGQQLISEGLDKEKSSFDGVEKGGAGDLSNAENISVEEPTVETVRSPKRRLEEEISEAPSETVVSERTVKKRQQAKEIQPEAPVSGEARNKRSKVEGARPGPKKGSTPKRRLEEKEISEAPSETVVSERTVKKRQQAKEIRPEAPVSGEARNKKRKVEGARPGPKKGSKELRRTSLYYAGTKWEAGVRRSTRIRMRPLEYWRGERFLYGRVHESLVTVIGVKYASPSKSKDAEEPGVKVKSFVSDKYKDLVDLAALH